MPARLCDFDPKITRGDVSLSHLVAEHLPPVSELAVGVFLRGIFHAPRTEATEEMAQGVDAVTAAQLPRDGFLARGEFGSFGSTWDGDHVVTVLQV